MVKVIISAIAAFIATNIDFTIVLTILFSEYKKKKSSIGNIALGQFLGITILFILTLLAVYGLDILPQRWLGLLGFVPIYLGLKIWFEKEKVDNNEIISSSHSFSKLFLSVAVITIADGGDNFGIYIPYFTTVSTSNIVLTILIYYILSIILFIICLGLSNIRIISNVLEKYEHIIVPLVFIGLGFIVLIENGTLVL